MSVLEKIERSMLKWFENVDRMGEERFVKRIYREMWRVTGERGKP